MDYSWGWIPGLLLLLIAWVLHRHNQEKNASIENVKRKNESQPRLEVLSTKVENWSNYIVVRTQVNRFFKQYFDDAEDHSSYPEWYDEQYRTKTKKFVSVLLSRKPNWIDFQNQLSEMPLSYIEKIPWPFFLLVFHAINHFRPGLLEVLSGEDNWNVRDCVAIICMKLIEIKPEALDKYPVHISNEIIQKLEENFLNDQRQLDYSIFFNALLALDYRKAVYCFSKIIDEERNRLILQCLKSYIEIFQSNFTRDNYMVNPENGYNLIIKLMYFPDPEVRLYAVYTNILLSFNPSVCDATIDALHFNNVVSYPEISNDIFNYICYGKNCIKDLKLTIDGTDENILALGERIFLDEQIMEILFQKLMSSVENDRKTAAEFCSNVKPKDYKYTRHQKAFLRQNKHHFITKKPEMVWKDYEGWWIPSDEWEDRCMYVVDYFPADIFREA